MILNNTQYLQLWDMLQRSYEYGYLSFRFGVALGITATYLAYPFNLKLTRSGYPDEVYTSITAFNAVYEQSTNNAIGGDPADGTVAVE